MSTPTLNEISKTWECRLTHTYSVDRYGLGKDRFGLDLFRFGLGKVWARLVSVWVRLG